jgi:hypothetical protein
METKTTYQLDEILILGELWGGGRGTLKINVPLNLMDTSDAVKKLAQTITDKNGDFVADTKRAIVWFTMTETIIINAKNYHHYESDCFTLGNPSDDEVQALFDAYDEIGE